MDVLIGFVIAILVSALVIWIVSKLGLGLSVDGYMGAIIAAIVIADYCPPLSTGYSASLYHHP